MEADGMGTFGPGNFENDAALDMRGAVCHVVETELGGFLRAEESDVEELEEIVACVAIKIALIEQCGLGPPSRDEAVALRTKILDLFDRDFEQLEPAEGFAEERRQVIAETLDKFVRLAERQT
jgi:hypothetical protein